ncbi:hypothetical protein NPIL_589111 [Nephila pilipes]|uniref:Transposase n=1 Tax=Nephila pilipes TaxID=299642 RepID=A0A8X6Q1D2_NEPPI|nr:hypothetical protein NPIL_589111 [Nephila pilipes]
MRQWTNELEYANDVVGRMDNTAFGGMKVWFSDEAHFHLDRYVNKQNQRMWGSEHPHFEIDRSLRTSYYLVRTVNLRNSGRKFCR